MATLLILQRVHTLPLHHLTSTRLMVPGLHHDLLANFLSLHDLPYVSTICLLYWIPLYKPSEVFVSLVSDRIWWICQASARILVFFFSCALHWVPRGTGNPMVAYVLIYGSFVRVSCFGAYTQE